MILLKNQKFALLTALFLIMGVVGGCFFEPRETEVPTSGSSITYLNPINPGNVWENLQISLQNSDALGWQEAMSEDFTYIPDSEVENQYPGFFAGWNKEREMAFIEGMYVSDVSISAQMRDDDFVVPGTSGTEVTWQGVIYVVGLADGQGGAPLKYSASAEITFHLEGSFWYIYEWRDMQGQNDPDNPDMLLSSMGVLRRTFGSKKTDNMLK